MTSDYSIQKEEEAWLTAQYCTYLIVWRGGVKIVCVDHFSYCMLTKWKLCCSLNVNHICKKEEPEREKKNKAIYSKSEGNTQKYIAMVLHHRHMEMATVPLPSICKWEKMALECGEQFPQVHSLATVSIIDSQSCHKTGHSPCLSLWRILWGPQGLTSIINH